MKSSIKLLIGFLSVVVLLGGFFAYRQYAARVIKNDGRVTGNTASNLYGGGYFC